MELEVSTNMFMQAVTLVRQMHSLSEDQVIASYCNMLEAMELCKAQCMHDIYMLQPPHLRTKAPITKATALAAKPQVPGAALPNQPIYQSTPPQPLCSSLKAEPYT